MNKLMKYIFFLIKKKIKVIKTMKNVLKIQIRVINNNKKNNTKN